MNHSNFQLFTILRTLKNQTVKKWDDYEVVLAKNYNNQHKNAGPRENNVRNSINCWLLTHIIAVVIVMINHISYGLKLPNIGSITWCMSLSGLEERR